MHQITVVAVGLLGMALGSAAAQPDRYTLPQQGPPMLSESECKVAPVDASHLFIVAGVMEGDTLTNLQLDDPNGSSTVVRVRVTSAQRNLTVLLQSHTPVIWDFEGMTQRVRRAIIVSDSRHQRVAVRGLPTERVEFPELARCRQRVLPPWLATAEQRGQALMTYFGRLADSVVFEGNPNSLAVPDAEFALTPKGQGIIDIRAARDIEQNSIFSRIRRAFAELMRDIEDRKPLELESFNELKDASKKPDAPVLMPKVTSSYIIQAASGRSRPVRSHARPCAGAGDISRRSRIDPT